jgi:hypothetical protein
MTTAWFEYGTMPSLSNSTSTVVQSIGSGTSDVSLSQPVTGLSSGITYFFRIAASNGVGERRGEVSRFEARYYYSSLTGTWTLLARPDLSNNAFNGFLSVSTLSLTQMTDLAPGYSQDVYRLVGTFSGFTLTVQRKSDATLYPLFQNVSGNITNGAVNSSMTSHNLGFYLGTSSNYYLRGVAVGYDPMYGDITVKVDMTTLFHTSDGVITLTGTWDASRK